MQYVQLAVTVIAVVFIIYLSYLFSKYLSAGASRINGAKHIKITDRLFLGQDKSLLIINVSGRYYLISVTPNAINMLKELEDDADFEAQPSSGAPGGFREMLQNIMKRNK